MIALKVAGNAGRAFFNASVNASANACLSSSCPVTDDGVMKAMPEVCSTCGSRLIDKVWVVECNCLVVEQPVKVELKPSTAVASSRKRSNA